VEEIAADRDRMAQEIMDSFVIDMQATGMDVVSFVIKEIRVHENHPETTYSHSSSISS